MARMRNWLLERRPELSAEQIGEHTDIIESRILESLQVVEFVLFIERMAGREILSETLDPMKLRTLARIYENFIQEAHA
jgi:acyl carrier protein